MKQLTFFLGALMVLFTESTYGQLANDPQLAGKKVTVRINDLLKLPAPLSTDSLLWEAEHLLRSSKESYTEHAVSIYRFLQKDAEAEEAEKLIVKKFPKGKMARTKALRDLVDADITEKERAKRHEKWQKQFGDAMKEDPKILSSSYIYLANVAASRREYDYSAKYAEKITNPLSRLTLLLVIGRSQLNNQDTALADKTFDDAYQVYLTLEDVPKFTRQDMLSFYAKALERKQDPAAGQLAAEYVQLFGTDDEEMLLIFAKDLDRQHRPLEAFLLLHQYIHEAMPTANALGLAKHLFTKLNSSEKGWDGYLQKAHTAKLESKRKAWKNAMVNKPAPDFNLKDLQGNEVQLKDFRGKIVVLDFWATWCQPCIRSFPGMQRAMNELAGDTAVVFLYVDTWERVADYETKVQEFLTKHGYDFHVLFDTMESGKNTAGAFGVTGIPAKFFIDEKGNIRFETKGSSDNVEEVAQEVIEKIKLIREAGSV